MAQRAESNLPRLRKGLAMSGRAKLGHRLSRAKLEHQSVRTKLEHRSARTKLRHRSGRVGAGLTGD